MSDTLPDPWTPPDAMVEKVARAADPVGWGWYDRTQAIPDGEMRSGYADALKVFRATAETKARAALAATPLAEAMALLKKWVALYEGEYAEALIQMCGDSEAAVVTEARALLASMKEGTDGT